MELTIALDRYDRHVPFFAGTARAPEGFSLRPLEIGESSDKRDGQDRHRRMLHDLEFDICELSLASTITALSRDPDLPIVCVPAFPRRLFSMSQMYVSARSSVAAPIDLVGKRIGVHAWQVTLSVLAKGDLKREYGVDWRDIDWVCMNPENQPITFPDGVRIDRMPPGADIGEMLLAGEIDALFSPQPRQSMLAAPDGYRRLFDDCRGEEIRYFRKYGFFPIMHLIGVKRALAERHPSLCRAVMDMWDDAKRQAYDYYGDSNYSLLAWGREAYEAERAALGADPWPSGLAANRANLEQFIDYCHDQGLIPQPLPVERLFDASVLDT
jgi:4,5-dihydroxyphthalate decarboxylase